MDVSPALIITIIPTLRQHAALLLSDRNLADEVIYACLEDGVQQLNGTTNCTAIRNSLLRVVHARCNDLQRARETHNRSAWESGDSRDPSESYTESHAAIEDVFARLPFADRAILLLVSVERINYEDAAEILAVPINTIAPKLAVARNALDGLLDVATSASQDRVDERTDANAPR